MGKHKDRDNAGHGAAHSPEEPESAVLTDPAGMAALAEERDRLNAEKAEIQGLLLRRQADFDNFKKRYERERAAIYDDATMEAVRQLLPVLDDLTRALQAAGEAGGGAREYAKGMELIHQQLSETLARMGLSPVEALGKPFDPNLHHAVQKEESGEAAADTVLEEFQRGYFFKDRLLRPAMVKVAVKG
jgi:molecular chaperone GrpE